MTQIQGVWEFTFKETKKTATVKQNEVCLSSSSDGAAKTIQMKLYCKKGKIIDSQWKGSGFTLQKINWIDDSHGECLWVDKNQKEITWSWKMPNQTAAGA